jgi:hypothetical protein
MQCANPECRNPAFDLSTGVLRLIELAVPPADRVVRSDGGFPVCSVPSRYFWLCPKCSSFLRIRQWTHDGLIFEQRLPGGATGANDFLFIPFDPQRPRTFSTTRRKTA